MRLRQSCQTGLAPQAEKFTMRQSPTAFTNPSIREDT